MSEFLERHLDDEHPYLAKVREAGRAGQCVEREPQHRVLDRAFASIYGVRAANLARYETPHALQLRVAVERLVRAATDEPGAGVTWWTFGLPHGRDYVFVERQSDLALLAAMVTVSRLDVSDSEWSALWGSPVREHSQ